MIDLVGWHRALIDAETRSKASGVHFRLVTLECEDARICVSLEFGALTVVFYTDADWAHVTAITPNTTHFTQVYLRATPRETLSDVLAVVSQPRRTPVLP